MYALSTGCTLLLFGSLSDVIGNRRVFLWGSALQSVFTFACGMSRTGTEMIAFRILSGLATSMCLPSAISIITESFPPGKLRNLAFASMGSGQPVGFGIGIIAGGLFADTIGWPWGFHTAAITNTLLLFLSIWQLPKRPNHAVSWNSLVYGVDWVGAFLISISLGLLSYFLAYVYYVLSAACFWRASNIQINRTITDDVSGVGKPSSIMLIALSAALLIGFVLWMDHQKKLDRPMLIANSLWRNATFSTVCWNVFMVWGAFNAFEQIINFFFQEIQGLDAATTAWQFMPTVVSGILSSFVTGLILHRMRADGIINITTMLSSISPVLMAIAQPSASYWGYPFSSLFLNCIGADSLFIVSNIIIARVFPPEMHGLAGGVYNTVAQVGKSVALALVALISNSVANTSGGKNDPEALLKGYHAAFWFILAMNIASLLASFFGLRKVGRL